MPHLPACPTAQPNDDDLTGVVTHLAPLTTRRGLVNRDPNEPEVRWLLEAGIKAMCEGLLDRSSEATGPMAYSHANSLFDTLPVERVMHCFRAMCTEQGIDPGSANKARLIRRWSFAANYQLDLIAYVFRPGLLDHTITEAERAVRAAFPRPSLGELVDSFCTPRSEFSPLDSIVRIQHILRLMFPGDCAIKGYAQRLHDLTCQRWGRFSADFAAACGVHLHRGDHVELIAIMHLIGEAALLQSPSMNRSTLLHDGTSASLTAIHLIMESAYGRPWDELADLRPDFPPPVEDGALTPGCRSPSPRPAAPNDTSSSSMTPCGRCSPTSRPGPP